MNATLEATARALFKSWFVDFDPVRAKAEGRDPDGMDATIAALFPARFDESELGLIPSGWRVGTLEDLLVLKRGFDLPTQDRVEGIYPILAASGFSGTHHEYKVKGPGVTTGRSGVIGKVFYVQEDFWALNTSLFVEQFKVASPIYAYYFLQTLDLGAYNAGSAVPTLNRNHVHGLPVCLPSAETIRAFEAIAQPMFQAMKAHENESNTLAATRDALLPRLMSGELRVGGS